VVGSVETFALGIAVSGAACVVCVFDFVDRLVVFRVGAVLLFCVVVLVFAF